MIGAQMQCNSYSIATRLNIQLREGIGDWGLEMRKIPGKLVFLTL
jgi:hypothetical protein